MIRALVPGNADAVARGAFAAIPVPLDPPPSALRLTAVEVLAREKVAGLGFIMPSKPGGRGPVSGGP